MFECQYIILSSESWSYLRAGSWERSKKIGYAMNPAASGRGMMVDRRSASGGLERRNVEDPPAEDCV